MSKEELQKRLNNILAKLDELTYLFYCDKSGFQTFVQDRLPRLKKILSHDKTAIATLSKYEKKASVNLENAKILEYEAKQDKQHISQMLKYSMKYQIKDSGVEKLTELEQKVASGGYYKRHHGELAKDLSQMTVGSTALLDNDIEK